jgi:hypothetical protein
MLFSVWVQMPRLVVSCSVAYWNWKRNETQGWPLAVENACFIDTVISISFLPLSFHVYSVHSSFIPTELHGRVVVFLLHIREVLGSNIGLETVRPGIFSFFFPQFLHIIAVIVLQFRPRPFPSTSFPINYSQTVLSFNPIYAEKLTASLNEP